MLSFKITKLTQEKECNVKFLDQHIGTKTAINTIKFYVRLVYKFCLLNSPVSHILYEL